ncbi:GNAT family N-acetyltransferase [Oerskovia jenensis]|uniref:RimJ/RimL family protein N-acetyltransferase n=1 Tax=Oerskovia jenensis TaxID=162169 RepID=A0ABS2LGE9_9CELL|nr:GNAT family N-acetyltransferase [Oerskovia jenensis]MBM7479495.1 RimJ/RimL family protein N-acetyltransferase [Oerskovia jenensis]
MFSQTITDFWRAPLVGGDVLHRDEALTVVSNPGLPEDRRVTVLTTRGADASDSPAAPTASLTDGPGAVLVAVTPQIAGLLDLAGPRAVTEASVRRALQDAGITLHEADCVFHLTQHATTALRAEADAPTVRRLTALDAAAFSAFEASAPEQDLDDAYVELDHWAVFGAFEGERLVAAASTYPWGDSRLADTGVLTLPDARGKGHARQVVRAISRHALSQGYEPQYRCQVDNAASRALAARAGFTQLGTWEVVSPDSAV